MLTMVIPTIRPTVERAIESVLAEGLPCIAVLDGPDVREPTPRPGLTVIRLGRNYGRMDGVLWYGQIAFDTGCRIAQTEFAGGLGDDDELLPSAGQLLREAIAARPKVDLWVPGLQYNDGRLACVTRGKMECGNVSHVIYRSKILAQYPMYHEEAATAHIHDWCHAKDCESRYTIDWIGRPCIGIRPRLPGSNGFGQ